MERGNEGYKEFRKNHHKKDPMQYNLALKPMYIKGAFVTKALLFFIRLINDNFFVLSIV